MLLLSALSYIDIEKFYEENLEKDGYKGTTLQEFAQIVKQNIIKTNEKIEYNGGYTHEEFLELLQEIAEDSTLKELKMIDYLNDNKQGKEDTEFTGFVGLALQDEKGISIIVSRGSEGENQQKMEDVASPYLSQDWIDNYRLASEGSEQFPIMKDFVERNFSDCGYPTFVTGHSKGAANALYAAAVLENVTGVVFDGPGITQLLSPEQIRRLRSSGIKNYVAEGDVVGALFFHAEDVVYVKTSPYVEKNGKIEYKYCYRSNSLEDEGFFLTLDTKNWEDIPHFHYLQAIDFDDQGNVIETMQGLWSYAATMASQKLYRENLLDFKRAEFLMDGYEVIKEGGILIDSFKNKWLIEDNDTWEKKIKNIFLRKINMENNK